MTDRELRVSVVEFGDRKNYQLQWIDPVTGKKKTQSSGVENTGRRKDRQDAERAAADLEAKLLRGTAADAGRVTWEQFRRRYTNEVLASLAENTANKANTAFNAVESILNPQRLRQMTSERLSHFQAELRSRDIAETTIKSTLAHLMSALRWAGRMGLLAVVPKVNMPKRSSGKMKGRPLAREEFERMLDKIEAGLRSVSERKPPKKKPSKRPLSAQGLAAVREKLAREAAAAAPAYRYYLEGLWRGGLRLSESLDLWWDKDDALCVDLTGKRPMLRIPADDEKGNKNRLLPMAPEFAEFLLDTPPEQRQGRVFELPSRRGRQPTAEYVSRVIVAIGRKAGVKVGTNREGEPKYAGAHDLRRSFGERWSLRVMPQVLMELMRHESITTTLKFYVGKNAERTADVLWEAHNAAQKQRGESNTFGNTRQESPDSSPSESPQVADE